MEERYGLQGGNYRHTLTIYDREHMEISGVSHVESFDDEEVILETELGLLAIKGEELHIKNLNLEKGELLIEGHILELAYAEDKDIKGRGKSFMEKLFR